MKRRRQVKALPCRYTLVLSLYSIKKVGAQSFDSLKVTEGEEVEEKEEENKHWPLFITQTMD